MASFLALEWDLGAKTDSEKEPVTIWMRIKLTKLNETLLSLELL